MSVPESTELSTHDQADLAGPLLRAAQLTIAYGRNRVLTAVSLTVKVGELWFLLGGNGQGKTSFLRAALGLLQPAAGTLWRHPTLAARDRIGFVPQRCDLNPSLPTTVREFVRLGLVGISAGAQEASERLSQALDEVGLSDLRQRDYQALSGGQRQRALLARALIRRPSLLLLDEPTNGLDPASEEALLQTLFSHSRSQGQTVLFVTHDVALARRHATHVALFHDGTVLAGTSQAVLTTANLARVYGLESSTHAERLGGHR